MVNKTKFTTILGITVVIITAATIGSRALLPISHAADEKSSANAQPPPMPVDVVVVERQSIRIWKNYSGRLTAVDFVEIRPQTSGAIKDVKFEDGQFVNKDDILYIIDPRPLKAALEKAKADLVIARNRLTFANQEYERTKNLVETFRSVLRNG